MLKFSLKCTETIRQLVLVLAKLVNFTLVAQSYLFVYEVLESVRSLFYIPLPARTSISYSLYTHPRSLVYFSILSPLPPISSYPLPKNVHYIPGTDPADRGRCCLLNPLKGRWSQVAPGCPKAPQSISILTRPLTSLLTGCQTPTPTFTFTQCTVVIGYYTPAEGTLSIC